MKIDTVAYFLEVHWFPGTERSDLQLAMMSSIEETVLSLMNV